MKPLTAYVVLFPLLPSISCDDLINKTCKKTPRYHLCLSSLESDTDSLTADVKGLLLIMANITLSNVTATLDYIQGQINETTDPNMEQRLSYCAEQYIPIVNCILPQAIEALTDGFYEFANYGISYASNEADSCQKKFSGSHKSRLTQRSTLMHDLSYITVAIVNILQMG